MLKLGPPLGTGERVLVRLPSWLGDIVAAEPAVRALAERLDSPEGEGLSLAAPSRLLPILDGLFPAARRLPVASRGAESARDWSGHGVAVLFTGSFRSAWTAWRAGIPRRVGWARDGRGPLLTDAMVPARERGGLPIGLGLRGRGSRILPRPFGATCAELVGLVGAEVRDPWPRVTTGAWPGSLPRTLLEAGDYLLVNAGCRPGSAKGVPAELFGAALRLAAPLGLPVVVVGGPGEEAAVAAVVDEVRGAGLDLHPTLPNVPDLGQLAHLCAHARVAWTADAGPLHVLRATRTPRVVLQGPTDPRHTAELLTDEVRLRMEVPCGPCHLEHCPNPEPELHRCMRAIEPRSLVAATCSLLGLPAPPS